MTVDPLETGRLLGERYRIVEEAIAHDGSVETFPAYEHATAAAAPTPASETEAGPVRSTR